MNTRAYGAGGEELAVSFLEMNGCVILDRNYTLNDAEIDIVFREGKYIVFCEVKYRSTDIYGDALSQVGRAKARRIVKASVVYMYRKHISFDSYIRYDVIYIEGNKIGWIKNAYDSLI